MKTKVIPYKTKKTDVWFEVEPEKSRNPEEGTPLDKYKKQCHQYNYQFEKAKECVCEGDSEGIRTKEACEVATIEWARKIKELNLEQEKHEQSVFEEFQLYSGTIDGYGNIRKNAIEFHTAVIQKKDISIIEKERMELLMAFHYLISGLKPVSKQERTIIWEHYEALMQNHTRSDSKTGKFLDKLQGECASQELKKGEPVISELHGHYLLYKDGLDDYKGFMAAFNDIVFFRFKVEDRHQADQIVHWIDEEIEKLSTNLSWRKPFANKKIKKEIDKLEKRKKELKKEDWLNLKAKNNHKA